MASHTFIFPNISCGHFLSGRARELLTFRGTKLVGKDALLLGSSNESYLAIFSREIIGKAAKKNIGSRRGNLIGDS